MFPTRLAVADMLDIPFQVENWEAKSMEIGKVQKIEVIKKHILGGIKQYKGMVILSDFTYNNT